MLVTGIGDWRQFLVTQNQYQFPVSWCTCWKWIIFGFTRWAPRFCFQFLQLFGHFFQFFFEKVGWNIGFINIGSLVCSSPYRWVCNLALHFLAFANCRLSCTDDMNVVFLQNNNINTNYLLRLFTFRKIVSIQANNLAFRIFCNFFFVHWFITEPFLGVLGHW